VGERKEIIKNKLSLELRPRLEKEMIIFNKGKDFLILDFFWMLEILQITAED
jgi:hypothetical protein